MMDDETKKEEEVMKDSSKDNTTRSWVERYRPRTLHDIVGHEDIRTLLHAFVTNDTLPHLLFYGPPGTGKTSTILAVHRQLHKGKKKSNHILIVDASTERGIDMVRERIGLFVKRSGSGTKMVILDEADALTPSAQGALRRVVEDFAQGTRFCFLCNTVSALTPPLRSRCMAFRFNPLSTSQMRGRLRCIADKENMAPAWSNAVIPLAMKYGDGDMRHTIHLMQRASTETNVSDACMSEWAGRAPPVSARFWRHLLCSDEKERKKASLCHAESLYFQHRM